MLKKLEKLASKIEALDLENKLLILQDDNMAPDDINRLSRILREKLHKENAICLFTGPAKTCVGVFDIKDGKISNSKTVDKERILEALKMAIKGIEGPQKQREIVEQLINNN